MKKNLTRALIALIMLASASNLVAATQLACPGINYWVTKNTCENAPQNQTHNKWGRHTGHKKCYQCTNQANQKSYQISGCPTTSNGCWTTN